MEALLHIGIGKTGTTSIGAALAANAASLASNGVYVPRSIRRGQARHIKLGAYALRDDVFTAIRRAAQVTPDTLESFRIAFAHALEAELIDLPADARIVCSDVGLCSLYREDELHRLRDLVAPLVERVRIVIYLRRQDRLAVSRLHQHLQSGRARSRKLLTHPMMQYDRLLELWGGVFGTENLIVRLFEPGAFEGGDVVSDFFAACGLPAPQTAAGLRRNTSFEPAAERLLLAVNLQDPPALRDFSPARMHLLDRLAARGGGAGLKPGRMAARRFYDGFAEINERVRTRWFGDRETLFSEDFSAYPESSTETPGAVAALAAELLPALGDEYPDLNRVIAGLAGEAASSME